MNLFHRAVFVASIVLIGCIDTTSATMEGEKSKGMPSKPSLRAQTLIETTNQDIVERSLMQKEKTLGDDHASNEERGWLSKLLGYKLNLSTISDEGIAKIMASETAKEKAFHYLNRRDVNAQKAYVRLGGPNMSSTKEKFWNEYGPYYDSRNYGNY
ncbi:RxLR effector protein [Phytophthora megakarya]|uniref:RxLR effector protein n=1 Tax=Phytophthora megakarya TaxID=4795 RepID=A0A225WGC9_9STRA|nr:RxLR effector protein [Phytophthora megakarya]